jgi:putative SOS response-associated peptidase YedK
MINARAETVKSKPAYRIAFKHRRCLIPAEDYFFSRLSERIGEEHAPNRFFAITDPGSPLRSRAQITCTLKGLM